MVNNIIFCNSFIFNIHHFKKYKCTDNSRGVEKNYFAYMIRGNVKICAENETVIIKEGDTFFIPSGCRYLSHWYGNPDVEFISLGFVFLPNFENRYYEIQKIENNEKAIKLMYDIVNAPLDCISVGKLYTLVGMLLPNMEYSSNGKSTVFIDKVKRLIVSNPEYTVREIAKECAVSESTLYSAFKKHSDKSINEIKKSVIMEKARELLIVTDYPIEEIGRRLRFSSSSYFRKCFKEYFGSSPMEMRKREGF